MNLTPRKTEVEAVVSLLESDKFDSAEALAKAVIKTVFSELLERDWYVLGHSLSTDPNGALYVPLGPFSTENETEKFATKYLSGGHVMRRLLMSPARQARNVDTWDETARRIMSGEAIKCLHCGHPDYVHEHKGQSGQCALGHCQCTRFKN